MKLHRVFWGLLFLLLPVQLGKHFWPSFSFIQGLRIDYLSPTLYLTDLLVIGIIGSWLLEQIKKKRLKIKNTDQRSKIFIFFFFVFLITNCLLSQNPGAAFYLLIKIFEFVFLGFYIIHHQNQTSYFQLPTSIAVIYSSLLAIAQFIKQGSLGGILYWFGERTFTVGTPGIAKAIINGQLILRPYATFPHPNALAGFLLVGLILSFPYWWKRSKHFFCLYFILTTIAIFLTFSRSVWMAGILVCLFTVVNFLRKKQFNNLTIKQLAIILFSGFLVFWFTLSTFTPFSVNAVEGLSGNEAIFQRLDLNNAAIQMFRQSPLLGIGLNNFIVRLPEFQLNSGQVLLYQPVHNIYLLILAETGFVGLFVFLWFLFQTLKRIPASHLPLLTSILAILFLGLFDHYWLTLQPTRLLFTIVLGLSWSKIKT